MDLSEEEVYQYRERPEEDIVYSIGHGVLLLVLGIVRHVLMHFVFLRHLEACRLSHNAGLVRSIPYILKAVGRSARSKGLASEQLGISDEAI